MHAVHELDGRRSEGCRHDLHALGDDDVELGSEIVVVEERISELDAVTLRLGCELAAVPGDRVLVDRHRVEHEEVHPDRPGREAPCLSHLVGERLGAQIATCDEAEPTRIGNRGGELRRERARRRAARAPPELRARSRGETAEHDSEERVPERCLRERALAEHALDPRLASRRVVAVDERPQWEQREMLGECEAEGEAPRRDLRAAPREVEGESEGGAVRRVHGDPATGQARERVTNFPSSATSV